MVEAGGGFLGYFVTSRREVISTPSLVVELEKLTDNKAGQLARSSYSEMRQLGSSTK